MHSLLETTFFIIDLQVKKIGNKAFSRYVWSTIITTISSIITFYEQTMSSIQAY